MQGYDIYEFAERIPGRNAEPQPIIFAYIALNLQTLVQSGAGWSCKTCMVTLRRDMP